MKELFIKATGILVGLVGIYLLTVGAMSICGVL